MQGLTNWLEQKLVPIAARVGSQRHLTAIRDGLVVAIPFIIIGSLVLAFLNLPVGGGDDPIGNWRAVIAPAVPILLQVFSATFSTLCLFVAAGIGYSLANHYKLDGITGASLSLIAFLTTIVYPDDLSSIPFDFTGSKGLFVAIVISILAAEMYRWFVQRNIVIRMPEGVPPAVARSFQGLIPATSIIAVVAVLRLVFDGFFGLNLHELVGTVLGKPLTYLGGSYIGTLIAVFLVHLLWTFGLHGANIVGSVMEPIWLNQTLENTAAFEAGQAIPHIMNGGTLNFFTYLGGSGATLGLVLLMMMFARSRQLKQVGRTAIGAGLFNINEPVIFGMPIVLNPIMMIPFILTPMVLMTVNWIFMSIGLTPKVVLQAPWTAPVIMAGLLTTGGKVMGAVMQLVNVVIAALVYYPFFRVYDRQKAREEAGLAGEEAA